MYVFIDIKWIDLRVKVITIEARSWKGLRYASILVLQIYWQISRCIYNNRKNIIFLVLWLKVVAGIA